KAAVATLFDSNPGINWNRSKMKSGKGSFGYSIMNTKSELAFASIMFGFGVFAFSLNNLAGTIWLAWYGILYSLATILLFKYG
ncbi:MAG: hypothetical protein KGH49_01330, partial [Candidatus Micrarchaeota archaeon]|nr:hypothetical protein [Candidatus Micrarchaeota archaeon]